ncbi:MAG: beta-CASP ribonuclease aCPSF1 [Euryarchaeota archaeon]|nr:beta-CASP ribonuclease aCPSF1 [Euryarchaeota archaeon]
MSSEQILKKIKEEIKKVVPVGAVITDVEFEGPKVVISTRNPKIMMEDNGLVKKLAQKLQKRVVIRPDPSVLLDEEKAVEKIKEIVSKDAGITDISFDPVTCEVVIEAKKPGLVIGKSGETLREITKHVRWAPRVVRAPPLRTDTIAGVRAALRDDTEERKKILKRIGERIYREGSTEPDWVRVTSLGGFREVGRSAILLQTSESNVLLDCGVNVATDDPARAYPHLNVPEMKYVLSSQELDAVIITHAHLDHSGFVPYLYKYGYDGPVYSTPPTRDLSSLLQKDYIDVARREEKLVPYSSKEIKKTIRHTIPLEPRDVRDITPDIRLTLHSAGHILGSTSVHLHIGNGLHNLLYTGDFKFGNSRLLSKADIGFPRAETVITESTYGGSKDKLSPREKAEKEMIKVINKTLKRKGKVLIPALAVGRSQEVMLILEDYMRKGELDEAPIFIDGMIWEATAIHATYPEYLSKNLRRLILGKDQNPFLTDYFEGVGNTSKRESIKEGGPCIVIATSGMLIGGPSVEYFKSFADDPKNTMIFVSYQGEGTMGRRIQKGWNEIPMKKGNGKTKVVNVNMEIHTIDAFSGHSDRRQLMSFMSAMKRRVRKVLVCHGEPSKSIDLASSVYKKYRVETRAPMNLETVRLV